MVKKYIRVILMSLLFVFMFIMRLNAGIKDEIAFILRNNPIHVDSNNKKEKKDIPGEGTEIRLTALGLMRFYQIFISSQDTPRCMFSPSCSHFAMESMNKYGFFIGGIMTSDRLQRCNSIGAKYYNKKHRINKIHDPVKKYIINNEK